MGYPIPRPASQSHANLAASIEQVHIVSKVSTLAAILIHARGIMTAQPDRIRYASYDRTRHRLHQA